MAIRNEKILITGGAGYIGSHTIHFLLKHGFKKENIIVFDNLIYGHKKFLPAGILLIKGDLNKKSEILKVFRDNHIDTVIHFAALAFVGESFIKPGKYFKNNIQGGINLLEAMRKNNCKKILFSSSCAIYGAAKNGKIPEHKIKRPINPYGESKLMFEKILQWYWKIYKIRSVRLRYFNAAGAAYGIGESHKPETHLIPLIIKAALRKNGSVNIFGTNYPTKDGTCIRDYVHVLDLGNAHLKALEYFDKSNLGTDYFNIATGKGASVKQIIDLVKKYKNFRVIETKRRDGDPAVLIADPTKANKILGWKNKYGIKRIIKDAWEWHSNN